MNRAVASGAAGAWLINTYPVRLPNNQIIGVVMHLGQKYPKRPVILVSKDINMRIKSRALNLLAEDYFNDKVLEDTDVLYTGVLQLPASFWDKHGKGMESWQQQGYNYYRITGPLVMTMAMRATRAKTSASKTGCVLRRAAA